MLIHPYIWLERCEWIIANFRMGIGEYGEKTAFSSIRKSNKTDICNKLEFESQFSQLSWCAIFCKARSLIGCGFKFVISSAAFSPLTNKYFCCVIRNVPDMSIFCVGNDCTEWDIDC